MGLSRCYSLMKCLLILFNIIFLIVGTVVCCFCLWALWDGRVSVGGGAGVAGGAATARAGLCALALWAAVLLLGALCALSGAIRGSPSLLAASFALLALAAVAEGAAAWWGAQHSPALKTALLDELKHAVKHDYGRLDARSSAIDAIQDGLECCGVDGPRDWQGSWWSRARASDGGDRGIGEDGGDGEVGGDGAEPAALDLSVGAPTTYYWVPETCCETRDQSECASARRVSAASGGAAGLRGAGCGGRALRALARAARAPLAAGAALLAAHGAALLLALALCLRAGPRHHYKA